MKQVYLGGDMLKLGSQKQREWEKARLEQLGLTVYAPHDDKEINDKTNQTEESNNHLAEQIFHHDTAGMLASDILIFDVDDDNVGTTTEVGQFAMLAYLNDPRIQNKKFYFHSSDIRMTDLPEKGARRSYGLNQYLHGAVLALNPNGIETWEEIEAELEEEVEGWLRIKGELEN